MNQILKNLKLFLKRSFTNNVQRQIILTKLFFLTKNFNFVLQTASNLSRKCELFELVLKNVTKISKQDSENKKREETKENVCNLTKILKTVDLVKNVGYDRERSANSRPVSEFLHLSVQNCSSSIFFHLNFPGNPQNMTQLSKAGGRRVKN